MPGPLVQAPVHSCSAACQRCVFGNLFQCKVTGVEHLCDRYARGPWAFTCRVLLLPLIHH